MKYSAYGVGSYDSQSQYIPYVDILNLTVEKIPYNIEAAAAAVVGSNHPTRSTFPCCTSTRTGRRLFKK